MNIYIYIYIYIRYRPDVNLSRLLFYNTQVESVKRVLVVLGKMCEIDFCPLLVDLVAMLSNLLPEAAVYMAVYNMYVARVFFGSLEKASPFFDFKKRGGNSGLVRKRSNRKE